MGKIQLLDISVANLIAAGEVVDRPASAIKEMMENSIDAGATEITVEIKNGGSSFMRVSDNGHGMDREDIATCVKRHATSKVREKQDLDGIMTLGFRGEALAAIAAVSEFRIMSRPHGAEMGTLLRLSEGNVVQYEPIGCPEGTTVIAEALFANMPARRKFLKKDITETGAVVAVVEKLALSHPEIAIRLIADEKPRFRTAGDGALLHAIYEVLGRDFAKKLVPVDDETEGIKVTGFIGRPDNVQGSRNRQNFFINGRYIKSTTATAALEQAFTSYCPPDKFPCCVLNIGIHPILVDVNVHPAKLEVKFSNEKIVFHAVYCAVRNALSGRIDAPAEPNLKLTGDDLRALGDLISFKADSAQAAAEIALQNERLTTPYMQISAFDAPRITHTPLPAQKTTATVEVEEEIPLARPVAESVPDRIKEARQTPRDSAQNPPPSPPPALLLDPITLTENGMPLPTAPGQISALHPNPDYVLPEGYDPDAAVREMADRAAQTKASPTAPPPLDTPLTALMNPAPPPKKEPLPLPDYRIEGVLFRCYIVVEAEGKLLLIDKHAAHERILFEQFKSNMAKMTTCPQMLLMPIPLRLTSIELASALEYASPISSLGFDFVKGEESGTVELIQIPSEVETARAGEVFSALVAGLAEGSTSPEVSRQTRLEKALFSAACKAAVKAGRVEDMGHLRYITEQVLTRPEIRFCPHGRPVALEMTQSQVEHLFHRS